MQYSDYRRIENRISRIARQQGYDGELYYDDDWPPKARTVGDLLNADALVLDARIYHRHGDEQAFAREVALAAVVGSTSKAAATAKSSAQKPVAPSKPVRRRGARR